MIYERVDIAAPLRQGDIFRCLPRADVSLAKLAVLINRGDAAAVTAQMSWSEAIDDENAIDTDTEADGSVTKRISAILPLVAVNAIMITQDCDASRASDISLCEILPLLRMNKDWKNISSLRRWVDILTKVSGDYAKWYYLPPSSDVQFSEKMAVEFNSTFRLPRQELENLKTFRVGRLCDTAMDHFRDKLANFFRRYAFDPWYPLTKEEFIEYQRNQHEEIKPYKWQE